MIEVKEPKEILDKAEHSLRIVDHMIYITYPLIKENILLKKVIEQLYDVANNIIESILHYEFMYKRIRLSQDQTQSQNFELFSIKCANNFEITKQEIETIEELFQLMEKHKESSFEFTRKNKLVIMSNNLKTKSINLEQLKRYLNILKIILKKTKSKITR